MDIEAHEDYEEIDTEETCRCVICDKRACIKNSYSVRGHRLIHKECMKKTFGEDIQRVFC